MGIVELFRLLLSDDGEIVIPINDEEKEDHCYVEFELECTLPNGESENILRLKDLVEKLPSIPNGPAPKFELEKNGI